MGSWPNLYLFNIYFVVLFFCVLVHRLAVKISLPFLQVVTVLIRVYNSEIRHVPLNGLSLWTRYLNFSVVYRHLYPGYQRVFLACGVSWTLDIFITQSVIVQKLKARDTPKHQSTIWTNLVPKVISLPLGKREEPGDEVGSGSGRSGLDSTSRQPRPKGFFLGKGPLPFS